MSQPNSQEKVVCMRCHGRKKVYKIMGGYSHMDTGGVQVTCPMCNGEGTIKPLSVVLQENEDKLKSKKPNKSENSVL